MGREDCKDAYGCTSGRVVARVLREVAGGRNHGDSARGDQVVNRLVKANRGGCGDGHGDDSWQLLIGRDPVQRRNDVAVAAVSVAAHGPDCEERKTELWVRGLG